MKDSSRHGRVAVVIGAVAMLGVLASVRLGQPSPISRRPRLGKLSGNVTADGSSTVGPYTTAAAELFRRAGAARST